MSRANAFYAGIHERDISFMNVFRFAVPMLALFFLCSQIFSKFGENPTLQFSQNLSLVSLKNCFREKKQEFLQRI